MRFMALRGVSAAFFAFARGREAVLAPPFEDFFAAFLPGRDAAFFGLFPADFLTAFFFAAFPGFVPDFFFTAMKWALLTKTDVGGAIIDIY
jgi:hypothetical protein